MPPPDTVALILIYAVLPGCQGSSRMHLPEVCAKAYQSHGIFLYDSSLRKKGKYYIMITAPKA
jgi:hypothetical protein